MKENVKNSHLDLDSRMLLILSLAPIVYVLLLLYFMPDRVPMHMDIRGNITRWWNKENMVMLGAVFSLLMAGIAWSVRPDKKIGKAHHIVVRAAFLMVYARFLQLLLRMMYVSPNATHARLADFDTSQYFALFFIPLYTLCGLFIHRVKPNWVLGVRSPWTLGSEEVWEYTHSIAGLPFLMASGLNFLILAIPPLPPASRFIASALVTALLFSYLFYASYLGHQRLRRTHPLT